MQEPRHSHFEKQIERIHKLIEGPDAQVEWNDRILDPDNPQQLRQIDISIRHDGKLTLIECRIHKEKQDVKWIEELIGRKVSLRADAVIAVSAAGFTDGAIKKARAFGIILRDILSLTEQEISAWGRCAKVGLTFYEYSNVAVTFRINTKVVPGDIWKQIKDHLEKNPGLFYDLIDKVSQTLDQKTPGFKLVKFDCNLGIEKPWLVGGCMIEGVDFSASVQTMHRQIKTPAVVLYGTPEKSSAKRCASIEITELENFEITQVADEVNIALDLSGVQMPLNHHFRSVGCDFGRIVNFKSLEVIAPPKFSISLDSILVGIRMV